MHNGFKYQEDLLPLFDQIPPMPLWKFIYMYHFSLLKRHKWNRTWVADDLGLNIRTLRMRIAEMLEHGYDIRKNASTNKRPPFHDVTKCEY